MSEIDRQRRWRLVLGEPAQGICGHILEDDDLRIDQALTAIYDPDSPKGLRGGNGASSPKVARWLGDIRKYFPSSIVKVMQNDALNRLDLKSMLTQPEILESIQPDIHLVAQLVALKGIIPNQTKSTARTIVGMVV